MNGGALAYWMYAIFALGGLGVYFALPQEGRWPRRAPAVLGLAALVGLLVLLGREYVSADTRSAYFYLFSGVALFGAVRVVTHHRPVYSAVYFVLVVLAVAGMMVLLSAEFLAAALVIVYAGAILVTYVFVIMLADPGPGARYDRAARAPLGAVIAGFVLAATISGAIAEAPLVSQSMTFDPAPAGVPGNESVNIPPGNTVAVGASIMSRYLVPLEVAGVLLLVAMIGALAVARKRIPADEAGRIGPILEQPLGESGRRAPPYSPELKV